MVRAWWPFTKKKMMEIFYATKQKASFLLKQVVSLGSRFFRFFFKRPEKTLFWMGIGSRKTSVARVILVKGTGRMLINKRPGEEYFQFNLQYIKDSKVPLTTLGLENTYDIYVKVHGGGLRGQTDAIKHGIARALSQNKVGDLPMSTKYRKDLKPTGILTRDPRRKERKKYGLKKARKAPQFSKR